MDMFLIFSQTQSSPKSIQMYQLVSCGIMVDSAQRSTLKNPGIGTETHKWNFCSSTVPLCVTILLGDQIEGTDSPYSVENDSPLGGYTVIGSFLYLNVTLLKGEVSRKNGEMKIAKKVWEIWKKCKYVFCSTLFTFFETNIFGWELWVPRCPYLEGTLI